MAVVSWTQGAEQDLEDILVYYFEEAGIRVAQSIYRRIRTHVETLKNFPERVRPGLVAGTRECVIPRLPFIALIQVEGDKVVVLSVLHTARKYPS